MISKKMYEMVSKPSPIRAMFEDGKNLIAKYGAENVYDFSLGNPNVNAPDEVKDAIKEVLDDTPSTIVHGYMSNSGFEDVREAIACHLNKEFDTALTYRNIIMTVGAAGGLNTLFKVLIDPGDEVLVIAPFFGEYRSYSANYDAQPVVVPANPPSFLPDFKEMERLLSPKTKVVIVNTPNNPTGVVYSRSVLEELSALLTAKEKEFGTSIYLISDEPYREIAYDCGVPYIPSIYHNTIVGYSYSKTLSLPGERIGYLAISDEVDDSDLIIRACGDATRILGFVNAPSLMQKVVARCLDAQCDVNFYRRNRDYLYSALTEMGYTCVEPQGAFYMWVKSPIDDEGEFCKKAKDFRLIIVPGSGFGGKGWFRIAYCVSFDTVKNSLPSFKALKDFFSQK